VNNEFFTLEESDNGHDFLALETIKSAGNSFSLQKYKLNFLPHHHAKILYYRLKQTDFNSEFSYSPIVSVVGQEIEAQVSFTNPVIGNELHIFNIPVNTYKASIIDLTGKVIQTIRFPIREETNSYQTTRSSYLSIDEVQESGIYYLRLESQTQIINKKIYIIR